MQRRLLGFVCCIFLVGGLLVAGCRKEPPPSPADAANYVQKLNDATDLKTVRELQKEIYECGPDGLNAINEAVNKIDYRAKAQLIAVVSAMPDPQAMWIVDKQLHSHEPSARHMACYGLSLFPHATFRDVVSLLKSDNDLD